MASRFFTNAYKVTSNGAGSYTVSGNRFPSGYTVSDTVDPSNTDNPNILGDVAQDRFITNTTTGNNYAFYVGKTNGGFVSRYVNGNLGPTNNFYLYTDNAYANGATVSNFVFDDPSNAATQTAVCFASGTLIRTARGDVAVEHLAVGDLAVTTSGAHRPIRWIGHRTMNCRRHPRPEEAMPVRIRAHALGENRPARDLSVSPGHAICLDILGEVLVPANLLVNGTTIVQEDVDAVTYWHVELDSHDLLIAENQPAESYLDMGNRSFFVGGTVVDLDASPDADPALLTHADFCRPFHAGGPLLDVVRAQLRLRAQSLGWRLADAETWDDVHLEVDGVAVRPKTRGMSACFVLPAEAKDIWLVCPVGVPRFNGDNPDGRALGLALKGIRFDDGLGEAKTVALDDPLLCVGFHRVEVGHRWTVGRARFPAVLLEGLTGSVFLRLDLGLPALPRWVASDAVATTEEGQDAPQADNQDVLAA